MSCTRSPFSEHRSTFKSSLSNNVYQAYLLLHTRFERLLWLIRLINAMEYRVSADYGLTGGLNFISDCHAVVITFARLPQQQS